MTIKDEYIEKLLITAEYYEGENYHTEAAKIDDLIELIDSIAPEEFENPTVQKILEHLVVGASY